MNEREALAAALDSIQVAKSDFMGSEPGRIPRMEITGLAFGGLDVITTAARERLAQLEDSEGKRLHGLIREWNPDLNDYAVMQFAKQIMDTIGGHE